MNRKIIGLPLWVWLVVIGMIIYNCYLTNANTCSRSKALHTSVPTMAATMTPTMTPTMAATMAPLSVTQLLSASKEQVQSLSSSQLVNLLKSLSPETIKSIPQDKIQGLLGKLSPTQIAGIPQDIISTFMTALSSTTPTIEKFEDSNKIVVYNFWAAWCGYSQELLPEWQTFMAMVKDNPRIKAVDVMCQDKNHNDNTDPMIQEIMQQFNDQIQGYPTLIAVLPNNTIKQLRSRKAKNLLAEVSKLQ
jgi:thiol-disulfide isomerase/thioredoxin